MPINFTTTSAAPTNVGNSEQSQLVLFGRTSNSHTSATFTVDQQPFYVSAFNLGSDDIITVQQVFGQGSGTEISNFAPVNGPVQLSQARTKCRIDHPGRYQLFHTGSSALGSFTVTAYAATMSHNALSDLAEGIYAVLAGKTVYVDGVAPIEVTGVGSISDPYEIAFTGTSPPGFVSLTAQSPIAVSGNGSSISPYDLTTPDIVVQGTTPYSCIIGHGALGAGGGVVVVGRNASGAGAASVAVGNGAVAVNAADIAVGNNANSSGGDSLAAGFGANSSGPNGVAVGFNSVASGNQASALGSVAHATGAGSVAFGASATSAQTGSTAVGNSANASMSGTTAVGASAAATAANACSFGVSANASNSRAIAVGELAAASGAYGVAVGSSTAASADSAISVGHSATASGLSSVAVGANAHATADGATALSDDTTASGQAATAIGSGTTASGLSAVGIGGSAQANLDYTIAIGQTPLANGIGGIAIGHSAQATQSFAIAIGNRAGYNETHTNTIIIGADNTALNATQNNQIILGNSTQTQLVTAGSIIQGGAISASDRRLKRDVTPEQNALDMLDKLNPVTFKWDQEHVLDSLIPMNPDEFDKKQHGLIAQEVEQVLPEIVEHIDRGMGEYKFVRYDRLVTVLLAAIKELRQEVNTLKAAKG